MPLLPGQKLGPYDVLAPLGAGGMGEVYRARDTRLMRDVALKVVPAAFASDPDRMTRFQREACVLASLNHPHIAAIYGLEEADSTRALVMELVDGQTLAERLANGPLPVEEAIVLARQIAEAVEYAHEHGIVHRDLKPANVKLTPDGNVKVLDFGLAKALADDPLSPDVSSSPTLSAMATRAGVILGTAAYMSPEQAKGKPADRRADVWSFGVLLYEMLTARRVYDGETAAETLARVIEREPDLSGLPANAPVRVREVLRRCLTKDPKQRLQAIGEARIALEAALAGRSESSALAVPAANAGERRTPAFWVAVAVLGWTAAGAALWTRPRGSSSGTQAPRRLSIELGSDASLAIGPQASLGTAAVLSPDGSVLAFVARKAAGQPANLYVRRLANLEASLVPGTDGARHPFFSPDSQWIGFFADGKLKKIPAAGGVLPLTLCDAPDDRGGAWSEDGTIAFSPRATLGTGGGLWRVAASGGASEPLTAPDPAAQESTHRWPQALPGGRAVLFTAGPAGNFEDADIVVQALPQGQSKVLLRGGYHGRYLKSGHLVYVREGTLFAAPFDVTRLELRGPAVPVLAGVSASVISAGAQFAFSDAGTLVFLPGRSVDAALPIHFLTADGKAEPMRASAANYGNVRFSPDGQRLALDQREGRARDVWIYDWNRDTMSRLTFDQADDHGPVWTPNGQRIAFASTRADTVPNLYWQRADGVGDAQRLTESRNPQFPTSWHPSGRFLAFHESAPGTNWDLHVLELNGDEAAGWKPGKPAVVLNTPAFEGEGAFSPDGRFLAYRSSESGRDEIYVRPFPGPGGKWQVSTAGGSYPVWSRNGKELFYRTVEFALMSVRYGVEGGLFRPESPRQWSPRFLVGRGINNRTFDPHPDGRRFAILVRPAVETEERREKLVLVENFFEELRRAAPASAH
jgi:serine/threonine-protein kinase